MPFVILACCMFQGCAGPIVPRELNMQSPPDPKGSPIPEMVAATSAPFYIGPGPTQISLAMHAPAGPARSRAASTQRRVSIEVENVTCSKRSPSFRVYLNMPAGDPPERHSELRAGNLGMFGLVESSDPNGEHGGSGMSFSLDVTELFARLAAMRGWDPQNLRLSFVPAAWDAPVPQVRIGRVSLYFL